MNLFVFSTKMKYFLILFLSLCKFNLLIYNNNVNYIFFFYLVILEIYGGHYIIPGGMPYDGYHHLHLPHEPSLYPTLNKVPKTSFSCDGKIGYFADMEATCQV